MPTLQESRYLVEENSAGRRDFSSELFRGRSRMNGREAISFDANSPTVRAGFRSLSPSRMALLGSCAVVLIVIAYQGCKGLVAWVGRDPYHGLEFREIELTEPPPRWFKGSREQFLEEVRVGADLPEHLRMLEVSLSDLDQAFLRSPWVESVDRIERVFPDRLRVGLHYREPVAAVSLSGTAPSLVLDRAGDVLPDELDRSACLPLLEIKGLPGRFDARAGLPLRIAGGNEAGARIDPIVARATRLAGFLKHQGALDPLAKPPRNIVALAVRSEKGRIYLFSRSGFYISWGESAEPFDDANTRTRWNRLIAWFEHHPSDSVRHPAYLKFDGDEPVLSNDPAEAARRVDNNDRIR